MSKFAQNRVSEFSDRKFFMKKSSIFFSSKILKTRINGSRLSKYELPTPPGGWDRSILVNRKPEISGFRISNVKKNRSVTGPKMKIEISPPRVDVFGSYLVRLQYYIVLEVLKVWAQMANSNPLYQGVTDFPSQICCILWFGAQMGKFGTDFELRHPPKPPPQLQPPQKCLRMSVWVC